jgi:hypothetical protein
VTSMLGQTSSVTTVTTWRHHIGRRSRHDAPDQYFLAESVYWLFALCMLRDCAAPDAVFRGIKEHQHMIWLAPQVETAVQRWKARDD